MRQILTAAGIAVAATVVGVAAYASQSPSQPADPVPVSSSATIDDSAQMQVSDLPATAASPSPSASVDGPDDNGGMTDRDLRVEPGDDRDVARDGDHQDDSWDDDHGDDDWDDDWDDD
jgi:hypothetical protein